MKNRPRFWIRLGTPFLVATLVLVVVQIIMADPPVTISTNYQIFMDNVGTSGKTASTSYLLNVTVGEPTLGGEVASTSYKLYPGYRPFTGPDVAISKIVTPTTAAPGDAITYTLIFSNNEMSLAQGVVITDHIPVSVTNTSVISSGVAITRRVGARYVWDVAGLAYGESGIITITGVLSDVLAAGVFTNTATITATGDSDPTNNTGEASSTVQVDACVDVASVGLSLKTTGVVYTDTNVEFNADIAPNNAGKPYTYTVDYGDGTTPVTSGSSDDPLAAALDHTFVNTGTFSIKIAVWNCAMDPAEAVIDTVEVVVSEQGVTCVDVASVGLSLETTGMVYTGDNVEFNADITPDNAGKPYTYTVDYGTGPSTETSSDDPLALIHTWTSTGTYTVKATAWNCAMTVAVSDTVQITVTEKPSVVPTYTLTINTVGQGGVTLNPAGGVYTESTVVTLSALAAVGWEFGAWSGSPVAEIISGAATITMDGSKIVTTTFVEATRPTSDLGSSFKSVSLANVDTGDALTYTIHLHNSGSATATASLTDAIPSQVAYISGSVSATGGVVTVTGSLLEWTGDVIPGTPVIVQFAAKVNAGLAPGTAIENVAYLDDGVGNRFDLRAGSLFNPSYGLSLDDGALYTNIPTVTLSIKWGGETPAITQLWVSNDGGFGAGSGWIAANGTYTDWRMATLGDLRMPRTVYIKFRAADGRQYGPVQDDIIYDPTPPAVVDITIVDSSMMSVMSATGQDVVLRVTTSDDNSGVSKVIISDDGVCDAGDKSFDVTQSTQEFGWTLQNSGEVYICAKDRASNVSSPPAFVQGEADNTIFLPLVVRNLGGQ